MSILLFSVFLHLLSSPLSVAAPSPPSPQDACPATPRLYASQDLYRHPAPASAKARAEKNATLFGLFPVHMSDCRHILRAKNYNGFQRAEAMAFALDMVNEQVSKGQRKVALDGLLYDSCSNGISSIATVLNVMAEDKRDKNVAGLVGASYSTVSTSVSSVLQSFNVSMLSFASTSIMLSNKTDHPLFGRLLPSDVGQTMAVYDLTLALGWKTVQVLATKNNAYSKSLNEEFHKLAYANGEITICHTFELKIGQKNKARSVLEQLMSSPVDGIISFLTADTKRLLVHTLSEILRDQPDGWEENYFRLIGTDAWDIDDLGDDRVEEFLADRSYVIIPATTGTMALHHGKNVTRHMEQLTPRTSRNPWIREIWEDMLGCRGRKCDNKKIEWDQFQIDTKVDFVLDTVLTFSDALERCYKDRCDVHSTEFFQNYILTTDINDEGCQVKFDCQGNRLGHYSIYQLLKKGPASKPKYLNVGSWSEDSRKANGKGFDSFRRFGGDDRKLSCRTECSFNQYEELQDDYGCCFLCKNLTALYVKESFGKTRRCDLGTWPDYSRAYNVCRVLPVETLDLTDGLSLVAVGNALLGLLVAVGIFCFAGLHHDHRIIRNGSRELSFLIWLGVVINHSYTLLVFFAEPGAFNCALMRFAMSVGYSLILAALFLKTNTIFRIFYGQFKPTAGALGKVTYTSPFHQVMICLGLTFVQVLLVLLWLALEPPTELHVYPERRHVLVCQVTPSHLLLVQIYNIVLCIVTTAYSFLTRHVPQNFNESKWINLAMYSVCISWVFQAIGWSFLEDLNIPERHLQYSPERNWAIASLATSSLATFLLLFLYVHRIYRIIKSKRHPETEEDDGQPQIIRLNTNREQ